MLEIKFNTDFKFGKPISRIAKEKIRNDEATQLFMATTWHRLIDPFVPMDTGNLAHDGVEIYAEGNAGIIHYKASYAQKTYEGESRNFSREKHPLATAHWDEAALAAGKLNELVQSVTDYIYSRSGE